jgi:hypothetical protein
MNKNNDSNTRMKRIGSLRLVLQSETIRSSMLDSVTGAGGGSIVSVTAVLQRPTGRLVPHEQAPGGAEGGQMPLTRRLPKRGF